MATPVFHGISAPLLPPNCPALSPPWSCDAETQRPLLSVPLSWHLGDVESSGNMLFPYGSRRLQSLPPLPTPLGLLLCLILFLWSPKMPGSWGSILSPLLFSIPTLPWGLLVPPRLPILQTCQIHTPNSLLQVPQMTCCCHLKLYFSATLNCTPAEPFPRSCPLHPPCHHIFICSPVPACLHLYCVLGAPPSSPDQCSPLCSPSPARPPCTSRDTHRGCLRTPCFVPLTSDCCLGVKMLGCCPLVPPAAYYPVLSSRKPSLPSPCLADLSNLFYHPQHHHNWIYYSPWR